MKYLLRKPRSCPKFQQEKDAPDQSIMAYSTIRACTSWVTSKLIRHSLYCSQLSTKLYRDQRVVAVFQLTTMADIWRALNLLNKINNYLITIKTITIILCPFFSIRRYQCQRYAGAAIVTPREQAARRMTFGGEFSVADWLVKSWRKTAQNRTIKRQRADDATGGHSDASTFDRISREKFSDGFRPKFSQSGSRIRTYPVHQNRITRSGTHYVPRGLLSPCLNYTLYRVPFRLSVTLFRRRDDSSQLLTPITAAAPRADSLVTYTAATWVVRWAMCINAQAPTSYLYTVYTQRAMHAAVSSRPFWQKKTADPPGAGYMTQSARI